MSSHSVEVTFTPLCCSCGKELECGMAQSDPSRAQGIFERDNPTERKDRRVFVTPCKDCFTFTGGKS
jgi:hypothetical protein